MPNLSGAYSWAVSKCNEANIGYSQTYRNEQTVNGITYYDCSSFIWYALLHNGFDCVSANGGSTWPFTTSSMPTVLPLLGFTQISDTGVWKPMDIVLHPGVHTELVYSGGNAGGITMGAHNDSVPLDRQVSINTYSITSGTYPQFWRYGNGLDETGYYCWMGWIPNESIYDYLTPSGLSVMGDAGQAYGMYQFDYRYGLVPFMQSCYDYNPSVYVDFLPYIQMGAGNSNLVNNSRLHSIFIDYATNRTTEFQYLQDKEAIESYLQPCIDYVQNNYGIDITTKDPTILGTAFSMAIRGGYVQAAQGFAGTSGLSDYNLLTHLYSYMANLHYDAGRWISGTAISQLDKATTDFGTTNNVYVIPYGGLPPEPTPTRKKKLPIWMMCRNPIYLYQRRFK